MKDAAIVNEAHSYAIQRSSIWRVLVRRAWVLLAVLAVSVFGARRALADYPSPAQRIEYPNNILVVSYPIQFRDEVRSAIVDYDSTHLAVTEWGGASSQASRVYAWEVRGESRVQDPAYTKTYSNLGACFYFGQGKILWKEEVCAGSNPFEHPIKRAEIIFSKDVYEHNPAYQNHISDWVNNTYRHEFGHALGFRHVTSCSPASVYTEGADKCGYPWPTLLTTADRIFINLQYP